MSRRTRLMFFAVAAAALAVTLGVGLACQRSAARSPPMPGCSIDLPHSNGTSPTWCRPSASTTGASTPCSRNSYCSPRWQASRCCCGHSATSPASSPRTRRRTGHPAAQPGGMAAGGVSQLAARADRNRDGHARPAHAGRRLSGRGRPGQRHVRCLPGHRDVTIERFQPAPLLEASDGVGASGYVLIGLLGLFAGASFLSNVVGLGVAGNLISGGTIPLLNLVVGVEVAGGFAILASESLTRRRSSGRGGDERPGLRRRRLALPHRHLRRRDQPQPHSPGGLPISCAVRHRYLAAGDRVPQRRSRSGVRQPAPAPGPAVDAVMQALALTDVVVGAAVTALLLALAVQVHKRAGTLDPDALRQPGTDRRGPAVSASAVVPASVAVPLAARP